MSLTFSGSAFTFTLGSRSRLEVFVVRVHLQGVLDELQGGRLVGLWLRILQPETKILFMNLSNQCLGVKTIGLSRYSLSLPIQSQYFSFKYQLRQIPAACYF